MLINNKLWLTRSFAILVVMVCIGYGIYEVFRPPIQEHPQPPTEPICRICFLNADEPMDSTFPSQYVDWNHIDHPYSREQANNPVVNQGRFAIVRFENVTKQPVVLYSLHPDPELPNDPDFRKMQKELVSGITNDRQREKLLQSCDTPWVHTNQSTLEVRHDVRDAENNLLGSPNYYHSLLSGLSVPSPEMLLKRNPKSFVLNPGEWIDRPMWILGQPKQSFAGLKPGTYTVRALVSYAEAPSGEKKTVTSEPVTITITEEHIKAAEQYWVALSKANNP